MFTWWKQRRRRRILAQPFAPEWSAYLEANVRHYRFLRPAERERLRQLTAIFVAEKTWVDCGQPIDDELRVTVAGQAAVLLLGIETDYCFDNLRSVFVQPGGPAHPLALERWHLPPGVRYSGEAWPHGPLVIAWNHARANACGDTHDGRNLILHELAHRLDELDGELDGIPPFRAAEDAVRWEAEYERLLAQADDPHDLRLLGEYRVAEPIEFFTVATECFFQRPGALRRLHAEIYDLLRTFYGQDPAGAWPEAVAETPEAIAARLAEQESSYDASVQECVRQMHLSSESGDVSFAEGLIHLEHNRLDKALVCFDRAVEQSPKDVEIRWHRAACRLALEMTAEALADCEAALAQDPHEVEALRVRGRVYRALGDYDRSLADLNRVVFNTESDGDAYYQRGLTRAAAARHVEAVADYTRAIQCAPRNADYYVARCRSYRVLEMWAEAEADRQEALRRDPRLRRET
jgi:Mlc titration factor MtfA (ptsG expression regulator)/Flp pilus assembly protein TadD